MKIEIVLTKDNYDETEMPLVVNNEELNIGWLQISFEGTKYSVPTKELRDFAAAILASFNSTP
jgi:hypothetical protein